MLNNVYFSSSDQSERNAQAFSKSRRRLTQTYLHKFTEMILREPVQCNMAKFSEGKSCWTFEWGKEFLVKVKWVWKDSLLKNVILFV